MRAANSQKLAIYARLPVKTDRNRVGISFISRTHSSAVARLGHVASSVFCLIRFETLSIVFASFHSYPVYIYS